MSKIIETKEITKEEIKEESLDLEEIKKNNTKDKDEIINISNERIDLEINKIKENPIKYMIDWMDGNLIITGKKVFKLLSLIPCSLILPNIISNSTDIRATINCFIIGPPASGKSTFTRKLLNFSHSPISQKGISARKLIDKIDEYEGIFSLGIDDFSNILQQQDGFQVVKILEGALGDEQEVSFENMVVSINRKTHATGIVCGTWIDLQKYFICFKFIFLITS